MHILSSIKHELGIVEGILVPGATASTTNTTHAIQQKIADVYGVAIQKAVTDLGSNTEMTGPEKQQAIAVAVATDLLDKGFKAEFAKLRDVVVDVVQTAYRALEPNFGADIIALASAFHLGPTLTPIVDLGATLVQKAADKTLAPIAA